MNFKILGQVENFYIFDFLGEGKFGKVYLSCDKHKYDMFKINKCNIYKSDLLACKFLPLKAENCSMS